LNLLDFPFLGAAFASRNAAEGGGEERKIRSFLGEPERPKVLHFASESTPLMLKEHFGGPGGVTQLFPYMKADFKWKGDDFIIDARSILKSNNEYHGLERLALRKCHHGNANSRWNRWRR
jgi:hypothetical protein